MKSSIVYSYEQMNNRGCCRMFLNAKHAAITAAIYSLVSNFYIKINFSNLLIFNFCTNVEKITF